MRVERQNWRRCWVWFAAIGVLALPCPGYAQTVPIAKAATKVAIGSGDESIRPYHVKISQGALADLRRRLAATRWPERETVTDESQGVPLATMKALVSYWQSGHDWRKVEARLNALPQFVTSIDGLDIHFIHVRSKNANALPVIITHGWPGSVIEELKIIGPLTDPAAHGGKAEDAFDVVIPSLPGHGFSGKPSAPGWDPIRTARAWTVLMKRLGYTRFVAQGGDWGNAVTEQMALLGAPELIGIHTNMPATVPADVAKALQFGEAPPAGMSAEEKGAWDQLDSFYKHGLGLRPGNGESSADALRDRGFAGGARRLDARPRCAEPLVDRARIQRATRGTDARRHPRQRHALLVDEYGGLIGPTVLGEQAGVLRAEGRAGADCGERLSRRNLRGTEELDREGLSQADLLQPAAGRRAFCVVGAAGFVRARAARRVS